jgi:acetyltransferase
MDEVLPDLRRAVRSYPTQYVSPWTTKDGTAVTIRPIRPEDEPLMVKFHATLSEESVYLRYFHMEKLSTRVAHERLIRKCFVDYDREIALVVDHQNPQTGEHEIRGVGRLTKIPGTREAEVAVLVSDRFQKQGLGRELVRHLIEVGRAEKIGHIVAYILNENEGMRALARHFSFRTRDTGDPSMVVAVLDL